MNHPVFISYRRDDSVSQAREIHTALRSHPTAGAVFFDQRNIKPGERWPDNIQRALECAKIVLVIIYDSDKWLGLGKFGKRRIDSSEDWIRRELILALGTEKTVIPVLVGKENRMIPPEHLPEDIRSLADRQAIPLRVETWDSDVQALLKTVYGFSMDNLAPPLASGPFQIPHSRNPQFTGREELLSDIHASLTADQTTAIVQTVHGMGGVGKTQIAIEYAYRYATTYQAVWWLDAETPETLDGGLAALAFEVCATGMDSDQPTAVAAALRWLVSHGRGWLLIYDNATTVEAISSRVPHGGSARVLVTSRSPHWGSLATTLRVRLWERIESLEYIKTRTTQDSPIAAELAHELGDLPLALAQATGYISRTCCSFGEYLTLFRNQRRKLWQNDAYHKTVATTWNVTLGKLSKSAASALRLCSFLAPEPIPWTLLRTGAARVPKSLKKVLTDDLALFELRGELIDYALAEVSSETVSVHRLLQAVLRDSLKPATKRKWCAAAVNVMSATFGDSDDPADWQLLRMILPHLLVAVNFAEEQSVEANTSGRLLNNAGNFQSSQGAFDAAKHLLERSIAIGKRLSGEDHPTLATSYSNLAVVERDLGNLSAAKCLLKRAILISENGNIDEQQMLATRYSNLALVEQDLGNLAEAKRLLQCAVRINDEFCLEDDPRLATSYSNLALVEHCLGNPEEAKRLLERVIAVYTKAYGNDHPSLATTYSNLAAVEKDLENLTEARRLLVQAIVIDEKALSADHPTLATCYSNLSTVEQSLGNLAEAKRLMERAIAINEKVLGVDHPKLALNYNNLSVVERHLGNLAKAKSLLERAVAIHEKTYSDDHPALAMNYTNLAVLEQDLGNLAEAKCLLERAIVINVKVFTDNHPALATNYSNLASVECNLGNVVAARELWERALAIDVQHLPADHRYIVETRSNLASLDDSTAEAE